MSRITSIINRVRINIADKKATRWSDADIIESINEGILDFVTETKSLKDTLLVEIEAGVNTYDISDYAIDIVRVQYLNKTIKSYTEAQMHDLDPYWEDQIGQELEAIVFSDLNKGKFKVYPKITELAANIITQNQVYGGLIDITTDTELFNLLSAEDMPTQVNKYMTIYYVKRPAIVEIDSEMEIDADYDTAIVFYVTGMLLRGDTDAQNRSFSAEQLSLYGNVIARAKKSNFNNNNSTSGRATSYNGGFK